MPQKDAGPGHSRAGARAIVPKSGQVPEPRHDPEPYPEPAHTTSDQVKQLTGSTGSVGSALSAQERALAWQTGYDYALSPERVTDPERLAEIVDDIWHAASFAPPKTTFEERVARRHGDMLILALNSASTWRGMYPGGSVDWDTGRVLTAGATP